MKLIKALLGGFGVAAVFGAFVVGALSIADDLLKFVRGDMLNMRLMQVDAHSTMMGGLLFIIVAAFFFLMFHETLSLEEKARKQRELSDAVANSDTVKELRQRIKELESDKKELRNADGKLYNV